MSAAPDPVAEHEVAAALAVFDALWPLLVSGLPAAGVLNREELPLDDPWDPGVSELNLLVRPFMERAGLDDLDVFVELWDGDEKLRGLPDDNKGRPAHRPALWFDSVVEGLCIFAAEEAAVRQRDATIASAAAAVASAFLDQRRVDVGLVEDDELGSAWDVSAVALGFVAAQLPTPTVLSAEAALAVAGQVCRLGDTDPGQIELAIAPRFHPTFARYLVSG